jgi:hypothetical protein
MPGTEILSAAAGGACACLAGVLYYSERLPVVGGWFYRAHGDRVHAALVLTASAAMIGTPAGQWWHDMVTNLNEWLVGMIGHWTGLTVAGLLGLIALFKFVDDVASRTIQHRTRVLAAALPVLAATIPGKFGHAVVWALNVFTSTIGHLVTSWM